MGRRGVGEGRNLCTVLSEENWGIEHKKLKMRCADVYQQLQCQLSARTVH